MGRRSPALPIFNVFLLLGNQAVVKSQSKEFGELNSAAMSYGRAQRTA
jgi:hypothetical protein